MIGLGSAVMDHHVVDGHVRRMQLPVTLSSAAWRIRKCRRNWPERRLLTLRSSVPGMAPLDEREHTGELERRLIYGYWFDR
jgi:hypothetical protein